MYLVDSNVLIEAKNRYYAFDIAPGFWLWLEHAYRSSSVCSIVPVRDELVRIDDELSEWAKSHDDFFFPIDAVTTRQFRELTQWTSTRSYLTAAITEFLTNTADFYLVAYAKAHGHILVTHEQPSPESKKRILIPDACLGVGVVYENPFTMLRKTNARLDFQLPSSA